MVYDIEHGFHQHPAETTRDNFQQHFTNVTILPLHLVRQNNKAVSSSSSSSSNKSPNDAAVDPLLAYLFCHVITHAPHTCQHIQQGRWQGIAKAQVNPSVTLDPDWLAVQAYQAGMLSKDMKRNAVGWEILRYWKYLQENQQQQEQDEVWPLQCWDEAKLQRLERLSWTFQERLFGNSTELQEQHAQGFARTKRKFCHLNATAALELPVWQEFLGQLGNDKALLADDKGL